ncbi:MAG: hypothetical protein SFV20_06945 [Sphingopyxis sp.]|nr:hypothetical protein [Sphingopyxis sp.]
MNYGFFTRNLYRCRTFLVCQKGITMPQNIATDASLLAKLAAASRVALTREQLRRQRVSFIYGSLPKESTITRQQIENVLSKSEGEPA